PVFYGLVHVDFYRYIEMWSCEFTFTQSFCDDFTHLSERNTLILCTEIQSGSSRSSFGCRNSFFRCFFYISFYNPAAITCTADVLEINAFFRSYLFGKRGGFYSSFFCFGRRGFRPC